MSQKLPVNKFEWIGETSQFNEDSIKNYNEGNDEGWSGIFLKLMHNTQKNYMNFILTCYLYQNERKFKK